MTTLTDLRAQIDALDAELLRLVDARAALGRAIGEAKAREGAGNDTVSLLRPDREAILIRKLLAMPREAASDSVVVRIWRELISENLRIQGQARGGLHLNLSAREHSREVLVWARERFGFAPSFGYVDDATAAIAAARDICHISVLSLDPRGGAWWARLLAEKSVRIIAALPEISRTRPHAVAVAAITPEPTGDDITFWVSDSAERENLIIDDLAERGFAADWVCSAQGLKLFSLLGFVQEDDIRLKGALGSLTGIIGAAPRI
ncbi:chorismate mutase [Asticcacaulis sp. AC402]|uniref:chorismate mutase n=1 Tax=Asticcacaulis sp. AC402 TaxID=1282361 RepID=UPI0003C3AE42|nr:chorismate mutase [Asticcacaulis sp. AC402]ESQ77185.1 chorismate mutase [Asticcacaulis sp. AC402]